MTFSVGSFPVTASNSLTLSIDGMSCASCVGRVERALKAVPGVSDVAVNLASETARLSHDGGTEEILAALDKAGYPARVSEAALRIDEMTCASCVGRVERALKAVPGVLSAEVNLASETARVRFTEGAVATGDLLRATDAVGYPAHLLDATARNEGFTEKKDAEYRVLLRDMLVAALLAAPVFVVEMGGHLVAPFHHWIARTIGTETSWIAQFVLTTLVLVGPGRRFFRKGVPALLRGAPDMNSLVAVGTTAAYLFSTLVTFAPSLIPAASRAVYFEAAAVIVVLILFGRMMEARAKGRTGAAIRRLVGLQPRTARVERDGVALDLPLAELRRGDLVVLHPGERIAADGVVTRGESWVDESMITGEPAPVRKAEGEPVTGGTVNGQGALTFRAEKVGRDTALAQIIRMVEEAQGAKLPIQGLVDRITLWFVPAVMAAALATVVIWLIFGPAPVLTHALVAGVSVLIIACPCAMGLATPTSIMVGTGRAAELGVLFRKGDALQALQSVTIVAFDKTGTLTEGHPVLTDLAPLPGEDEVRVLSLVAGAEAGSEHPLSRAILAAAEARGLTVPQAETMEAVAGYGLRARVGGHDLLVGAERLLTKDGIDAAPLRAVAAVLSAKGRTPIFVAIDGKAVAVLAASDPIKPTARAAVAGLHGLGLKTVLITGDTEGTARAIAAEAGIDHVVAGVLPGGKVAALDALRDSAATRIAFVGDGINDAPALAHADVGIAIGTGTDVAIETADVVLMAGDPMGVVAALELSRRTMSNIRQNLFWAFAYNIALIPVAAGVLYPAFGILLSPMLAAGAMAMSSVFVLTNALRLRFVGARKRGS
jgi:P-type Cu+ transporter